MIQVSRIGLGTVKFGRNQGLHYPQAFEIPDDKTCIELLDCAQSLGINLLDTAPAYGLSEERLGKFLIKQREKWVLCTKVGEEFRNGQSYFDFSPHYIKQSIDRSLKNLKTDYLDIVLVHSNGEDEKIIKEDNVFSTLAELKKTGKIRAYGMSSKTVAGGLLTVEHADVAMVTYNPHAVADHAVISAAQQKNKIIFIKKALASGHLSKFSAKDPISEAMQFIFKEPGVTSVIVGTLNQEHLRHNVQVVKNIETFR